MRAVNLLPETRRGAPRRLPRPSIPVHPILLVSGVAVVAVVAGLGSTILSANSSVANKQQQLSTLNTRVAKASAKVALPTPTPGAHVDPRLIAVTTILGHRMSWDDFLGAFSRVVPEDVWLTNLQSTGPTTAPPAAPTTTPTSTTSSSSSTTTTTTPTPAPAPPATSGNISISGYTYSHPSVARLMRRLALVPWLSDVTLGTSTRTLLNPKTVYQFTVNATIVPVPESGS